MSKWIEIGQIESPVSKLTFTIYNLSTEEGIKWGCSCPIWKFTRPPKQDCKHIKLWKQHSIPTSIKVNDNCPLNIG